VEVPRVQRRAPDDLVHPAQVRDGELGRAERGRQWRVLQLRPGPLDSVRGDTPRAGDGESLRTPARELVQQDADRATYERRALAVERERTISENEMQSKIELARREEQLVTQRGANARRQAEEAAVANRTETEAQASRAQRLGDARAHAARVLGEATAATEAARVNAYRYLPEATLLGLAVKELAASLPQVGTLVLTPDLLTPLITRFAAGIGGGNAADATESSAAQTSAAQASAAQASAAQTSAADATDLPGPSS
jgi:hypothetical protein